MKRRIERTRCPVCRNSDILRPICTGCGGTGVAVVVYHPDGLQIDIYPSKDEAMVRALYPDEATTPSHERATVAVGWYDFALSIGLLIKSPTQQFEMKKAFYAGVYWFLTVLTEQLDADPQPTGDDIEYMQRVYAELIQFNDDVKSGRAR